MMTDDEIERIKAELLRDYPGAAIKVAPDQAEIVAEIDPKRAVAVIERSQPHFHRKMTIPMARGTSIYVTPSIESGSAYARDHLGSDGIPRQRLHFIHLEKGVVTDEYMVRAD